MSGKRRGYPRDRLCDIRSSETACVLFWRGCRACVDDYIRRDG